MLNASVSVASVIDFEDFDHGDLITSVTSSDGLLTATVSAVGGANEARIFDTDQTNTADPDLEADFQNTDGGPTIAPGNAIIIQEAASQASAIPDDNRSGGVITIEFSQVVNLLGFTVLDDADITIRTDKGHFFRHSVDVDRGFAILDLVGEGITQIQRLEFDFNGASGAFDNLIVTEHVTSVPVPLGGPMLLAGLAMAGFVLRRKTTG
ncbi:MAG: VPLPA-CTERM sorting domain-containing protein [Pseudomonadota bacterium]